MVQVGGVVVGPAGSDVGLDRGGEFVVDVASDWLVVDGAVVGGTVVEVPELGTVDCGTEAGGTVVAVGLSGEVHPAGGADEPV